MNVFPADEGLGVILRRLASAEPDTVGLAQLIEDRGALRTRVLHACNLATQARGVTIRKVGHAVRYLGRRRLACLLADETADRLASPEAGEGPAFLLEALATRS